MGGCSAPPRTLTGKRKAPISWAFETEIGESCLLPAEVKAVAPSLSQLAPDNLEQSLKAIFGQTCISFHISLFFRHNHYSHLQMKKPRHRKVRQCAQAGFRGSGRPHHLSICLPTMLGECSREQHPAPVEMLRLGLVRAGDQTTPRSHPHPPLMSSNPRGQEPGCEDLNWSQSLQPFTKVKINRIRTENEANKFDDPKFTCRLVSLYTLRIWPCYHTKSFCSCPCSYTQISCCIYDLRSDSKKEGILSYMSLWLIRKKS